MLDAAQGSNLFDTIHVSTDSQEIATVVKDLGFSVDFMRKDELSDDYTPIMPVLKWVLEQYKDRGDDFDEVATIMPCSPFVKSSDLINASNILENSNYKDSVLSVSAYPAPVEWAFRLEGDNELIPVQKEMLEKRSQDFEECYFDTGSFAFFSSNYIINSSGAGIRNSYTGCVIEKYKSIDIDNMDDWKYAEYLMLGLISLEKSNPSF